MWFPADRVFAEGKKNRLIHVLGSSFITSAIGAFFEDGRQVLARGAPGAVHSRKWGLRLGLCEPKG